MFVLDRLEGLARRTKQLLLYNLFDSLQSSNVQVRVQLHSGHPHGRVPCWTFDVACSNRYHPWTDLIGAIHGIGATACLCLHET